MVTATGDIRVLTWNIQSGGGTRVPQIMSEVDDLAPDLLVFTEVTHKNLAALKAALESRGLNHIATRCPQGRVNSVLVASAIPFQVTSDDIPADQERWVSVRFDSLDLTVLCIHIPGSDDHKFDAEGRGTSGERRKEAFWNEVIRYAKSKRDDRCIILGDFNTGLRELDMTPGATPFYLPENMAVLKMIGFTDTWRHLNPKSREYTWYSQQRGEDYNGFRLDYIFVSSPLVDSIENAEHVDYVRGKVSDGKLSDHAMLFADLNLAQHAQHAHQSADSHGSPTGLESATRPPSALAPELLGEIRQLLSSSTIRHGQAFRGIEQGVTAEEMAQEWGTTPQYVKNIMRSVRYLLDGEIPRGSAMTYENSFGYRELWQLGASPALLDHVVRSLHALQKLNPQVMIKPMGVVVFPDRSGRRKPAGKPKPLCPNCFLETPCYCE